MQDPDESRRISYQRAATRANAKRSARKIVLIGSKHCGKTSLLTRFLTNEFHEAYTPTVEEHHKHVYQHKGYNLNLDIVDMCAPFMFPVMRDLNVYTAHIVLLVYEIGNADSVQEAIAAFKVITEKEESDLSIVLVGTKFDLYPRTIDIAEYEESDELFKTLPKVNAGHVLTSAKLNTGIIEPFEKGLQWHVKYTHSGSLIEWQDVQQVSDKKKSRKCVIV